MHSAAKVPGDAEDYRSIDTEEGALELAENDQETEESERTPFVAHVFCGFALFVFMGILALVVMAVLGL